MDEIPLLGGNVTEAVVRVGDTVRRPVGEWTPAVHALLHHLEDVGFSAAPRVLGIDAQGREVLTYCEGVSLSLEGRQEGHADRWRGAADHVRTRLPVWLRLLGGRT